MYAHLIFKTTHLWNNNKKKTLIICQESCFRKCCSTLHFLVSPRVQKWNSHLIRIIFLALKQLLMHTHVRTHKITVCDSQGTSWFRARPGRRVFKAMGTTGHRREDEQSSAEMWRAKVWNQSLNKLSRATGGHKATRPVPLTSPGIQGSASSPLLSRISNSSLCVVHCL